MRRLGGYIQPRASKPEMAFGFPPEFRKIF